MQVNTIGGQFCAEMSPFQKLTKKTLVIPNQIEYDRCVLSLYMCTCVDPVVGFRLVSIFTGECTLLPFRVSEEIYPHMEKTLACAESNSNVGQGITTRTRPVHDDEVYNFDISFFLSLSLSRQLLLMSAFVPSLPFILIRPLSKRQQEPYPDFLPIRITIGSIQVSVLA